MPDERWKIMLRHTGETWWASVIDAPMEWGQDRDGEIIQLVRISDASRVPDQPKET